MKSLYEGAYRLSFPEGTNPAAELMQKRNGAYAGILVNSNGRIVGPADLKK